MRLSRAVPLVLALATAALADVEFLTPAAGSVAKGGDVLTVHWRDSRNPPKLSELTRYDLFLCAGGDAEHSYVRAYLICTIGC
jgi:hypothetical protein